MLSRIFVPIFVGLLLITALQPVMAQAAADRAPKKLGEFSGWEAYEAKQGSHSTCYMILRPSSMDYKMPIAAKVKLKGKKNPEQCLPPPKRSNVYVMVTLRPEESMNPVVSYRSGYGFKQNSEVLVNAGDKSFNLFTEKDQAWARNTAMDVQVTNALRKAKRVIIQGVSNDGGKSSDTFNPQGSDGAYKAIAKACGIS
ncbi:MAG: hypothetical protein K2Q32_01420 [Alphaproteobacteria bacterium]|nr:hypothetical protein [Alphaproteobacteria bacterium]